MSNEKYFENSRPYCAAGATLRTAGPNRRETQVAEKECRRCSIRRVLSRIGGSDQGPNLSNVATVSAFSSAQSGFGQPPDRAQICPMFVVRF